MKVAPPVTTGQADCSVVLSLLGRAQGVVVVGAGQRGVKHAAAVDSCQAAVLSGVSDVDSEALRQFRSKTLVTTHPLDLLVPEIADGAVFVLPHDTYLPLVTACLSRGVACLKEKPFARNLDEARDLKAITDVAGARFALATQRRHGHMLRVLRNLIDKHDSSPRLFEYVYSLGLDRSAPGWRSSRETAGGGAILDMGYHVIDTLTTLFGVPTSVHAATERHSRPTVGFPVEEGAALLLRYANGLSGTVILSRDLKPARERATFWFDDETVEYDRATLTRIRGGQTTSVSDVETGSQMLHRQLHEWLKHAAGLPSDSCTADAAFEAMTVIDMCYRSLDGISPGETISLT